MSFFTKKIFSFKPDILTAAVLEKIVESDIGPHMLTALPA